MSNQNLAQSSIINKQNSINFIEKDGQILFSAEEIGKQLGYQNPRQSITVLFSRNALELRNYSTNIKLISVDGKEREIRHFTEEGVYILSMLANTDKARDFRKRVAELLKEIRQKELAEQVELAREIAYKQGMEYAQSLPTVQIESKKAYLSGLEEGKKVKRSEDTFTQTMRVVDYLKKGLNLSEASKLAEQPYTTLKARLQRLGLWEQYKSGELAERSGKTAKTETFNQPEQLSLLPIDGKAI